MQIKYNLPNELFKFYNESCSIANKRKKINNYDGCVVPNSFKNSIFSFITILLLFIILNTIEANRGLIIKYILNGIMLFYLAWIILYFIIFFVNYKKLKKEFDGTITINEKQLIDKDINGIQIGIDLDKFTSLVIGNYSIVILMDNSLYIRLPIECEEEIVKAFKTYKSDVKIIRLHKED